MNIVISISVIIGFIYLGFSTRNILKQRVEFFDEMDRFINEFKVNVSFIQLGLNDFIKNFQTKSIDFNKLLKMFVSDGDIESQKNFYLCITPAELDTIKQFFASIGKTDVDNQLKELEFFKTQMDQLNKKSKNAYSKYASLSIKLGVLLGALVVIILLWLFRVGVSLCR